MAGVSSIGLSGRGNQSGQEWLKEASWFQGLKAVGFGYPKCACFASQVFGFPCILQWSFAVLKLSECFGDPG